MPFTKGTKRSAPRDSRHDSEDEVIASKPAKKSKTTKSSDGDECGVDKEGNPYWDLSNKRRVGVSQFNKTTFVNIREFYEKDGSMLPGKKGISLSVAQYEALLKAVPAINEKLRELGHTVENAEQAGGAPAATESNPSVKEKKSKAKKSNIEATSDEESA